MFSVPVGGSGQNTGVLAESVGLPVYVPGLSLPGPAGPDAQRGTDTGKAGTGRPTNTSVPPQLAGNPGQTASGNNSGEHAGDRLAQRPATLSKAARQSLLARWGASIRNRVERRKRYPRGTRAGGTTILRITVARTSQLVAVSVAKSSGNRTLDSAAISAVRRARYPRRPQKARCRALPLQPALGLYRKLSAAPLQGFNELPPLRSTLQVGLPTRVARRITDDDRSR